MNHIFHQQTKKPSRGGTALVAALAIGCLFGTVNQAAAQTVTPPATPTLITPQEGNTAFLLGHALGTQGYVCLPTGPGASTASWTVNGARPEATLFTKFFGQDVQIITHFLSPDAKPNGVLKRYPFWQRDVAEFLRYQQSLGSGSEWRCHSTEFRHSELPQCGLHCLPSADVHRVAIGTNGRQPPDAGHFRPTPEHQRGLGAR